MRLSFSCNIWKVVSEEAQGSFIAYINCSAFCWFIMVRGIFSLNTLDLLIPFKRHRQSECCCCPCPSLYDHNVSIFMLLAGYQISQSSDDLRIVFWTCQWVHCTQMASTVHSAESSGAPLGCGATDDSVSCSICFCWGKDCEWDVRLSMLRVISTWV